jgi:hypothetical protein
MPWRQSAGDGDAGIPRVEHRMPKIIAIWGLVAVASAGILAGIKRRDHSFWAAWSFIVPPMLIILLFMPRNRGPRLRRPSLDEQEEGA